MQLPTFVWGSLFHNCNHSLVLITAETGLSALLLGIIADKKVAGLKSTILETLDSYYTLLLMVNNMKCF